MSRQSIRLGLTYFAEQQRAASAIMDACVLARMGKVREALRERAERKGVASSELMAFVGPCEAEGILVVAVEIETARWFPELAQHQHEITPAPEGSVLVFCWTHKGNSTLRTYRLGAS